MKTFHFSLGPVQGFVAQARRTRDLWAGSFLLSWLSGQAMKSVLEQGGEIIFPAVGKPGGLEDPMLRAMFGDRTLCPRIGSLPNRFKAQVGEGFDPVVVENSITRKWRELADAVFELFVAEVAGMYGDGTREIWERQINHFWEIDWVLGKREATECGHISDGRWLDMRKNWRSHWPPEEAGEHCMLMGDYQEISGHLRNTKESRERQQQFWREMQDRAPDDRLDLRDNERLCAIALIKRLFPRIGEERLQSIIGWVPGGSYRSVANWPSTTYMAVVPWLEHIARSPDHTKKLRSYAETVSDTVKKSIFRKLASERAAKIRCLEALHGIPIGTGAKLDDLDGDLLHPHALKNHRTLYLSDRRSAGFDDDPDREARERLAGALRRLNGDVNRTARSYYALLLMDGDRLGRLLREHAPDEISRALLEFTGGVSGTVAQWDGVTIYAGGDDVLALLPMDKALGCAAALRTLYGECFAGRGIEEATASCAIILAHHQYPLQGVIREAHHQLDDIAKDANGRDSLAVAVLKPSGVTAQWVNPWETGHPDTGLEQLVREMAEGRFSRGFFHKMRDRYGFLDSVQDGPDDIDRKRLLVAEYLQSRERDTTLEEAEHCIDRLLGACRPFVRENGRPVPRPGLRLGGGFIARFMTQEED